MKHKIKNCWHGYKCLSCKSPSDNYGFTLSGLLNHLGKPLDYNGSEAWLRRNNKLAEELAKLKNNKIRTVNV